MAARRGRKKDFWDMHELLPKYTIARMLELHLLRCGNTHDRKQVLKNFRDFTHTNDDFNPECLRGQILRFIKEDFEIALAEG